jgi:hypothetical protein
VPTPSHRRHERARDGGASDSAKNPASASGRSSAGEVGDGGRERRIEQVGPPMRTIFRCAVAASVPAAPAHQQAVLGRVVTRTERARPALVIHLLWS